MASKITINGSYVVTNTLTATTVSENLGGTLTMNGSLYNNAALLVTSSWQQISQNQNKDFRSGVFSNNDFTSSIRLAIGSTGSFFVLWPQDSAMVGFSGSTTIWAQTNSGSALMDYTVVSLN
jgi:hypothetical protein